MFSPCEHYRYKLWRQWLPWAKSRLIINFLMLNPSTATEVQNDPTVERCEQRARMWGGCSMTITNLFAWRSTDPRAMKKTAHPIGDLNDHYILEAAKMSDLVVCAWGKDGAHQDRSNYVVRMLRRSKVDLYYLKLNGDGQPAHPLYPSYDLVPEPWD